MDEAMPKVRNRTRMRSKAERRRVVEETLQPGASVSQIARAHNVNANQVFQWRRLYRAGLLNENSVSGAAALLPVKISEKRKQLVPNAGKRKSVEATAGAIHIDLGYARVRIEANADPECVRAAMEGLRR